MYPRIDSVHGWVSLALATSQWALHSDNNGVSHDSSGEMRKLTEAARQTKWEEFLADLEQNPDPGHSWRTIKALWGFPASTVFSEPLVHYGRTFTSNQGKANAFMKGYAAVNRLNILQNRRKPHSSVEGSPQVAEGRRSMLPIVPVIGAWSCYTGNEIEGGGRAARKTYHLPSLKRWAYDQKPSC